MNIIITGLMIPFIGTAAGSACVFFLKNDLKTNVQKALTGFAAGVMVAASIWSLIIPAIDQSADKGNFVYLRNHNVSIRRKLQKPYFVSAKIMIDDLFNGFKKHHTHIALVRDKNRKIIGMVTMDDVLEELVSDISEPTHEKGRK